MGGFRSGRRTGRRTRPIAHQDLMSIDVRQLHRDGYLNVDARSSLSWTRFDRLVRSLHTRFDCCLGRLWLNGFRPSGTGDTVPHSQMIKLTYTNCNYGGDRTWFLCPACDRRCAILWGGIEFVCGECCRLSYPSQRLQPYDLAIQRAHKIRKSLDVPSNIAIGDIRRPRYMRHERFARLMHELIAAEAAWCASFARFGIRWPPAHPGLSETDQPTAVNPPMSLAA